jgi:hypothetical protein
MGLDFDNTNFTYITINNVNIMVVAMKVKGGAGFQLVIDYN